MITVKSEGSFNNIESFLYKMKKDDINSLLNNFGRQGVDALKINTPVDTGLAASSWDYQIEYKNGLYSIVWTNSNIESGVPVVILIQYGHATGTGGWVEGKDFINPAIRPLFDKFAQQLWERVKNG